MATHGFGKRAFDMSTVLVTAPLTAPLAAIAAVCVRLFDGRPVIYRQVRCGQGGRHFELLKFRTMRAGDGATVTVVGDRRVTSCGRVLRLLKLDELPQLWNVVLGNMSLVGPRPELPCWVERLPQEFSSVHRVPAGITDVASVWFHDEARFIERLLVQSPGASINEVYGEVVLPAKLSLSQRYLGERTTIKDGVVIALTLTCVLTRHVPAKPFARLIHLKPEQLPRLTPVPAAR